jgi:hypothetical protein
MSRREPTAVFHILTPLGKVSKETAGLYMTSGPPDFVGKTQIAPGIWTYMTDVPYNDPPPKPS